MSVADVYRALWRRRLLIVVLTLATLGIDAFFTSQQTKLYTASSLVRVEQKSTTAADQFGSLQTGALLAQTYAVIAQSSSIADRVKQELGPSVPPSAINIKAAQVGNIELFKVSATNADPVLAARIANAVPIALAQWAKESPGNSPDVINTVDRATPPTSPSYPNMKLNLLLGLLIGLVLNCGIVLLAAAFADRIGDAEDLEHLTGHRVIATIPTLPLGTVGDVAPPGRPAEVSTLARRRKTRESLGNESSG